TAGRTGHTHEPGSTPRLTASPAGAPKGPSAAGPHCGLAASPPCRTTFECTQERLSRVQALPTPTSAGTLPPAPEARASWLSAACAAEEQTRRGDTTEGRLHIPPGPPSSPLFARKSNPDPGGQPCNDCERPEESPRPGPTVQSG